MNPTTKVYAIYTSDEKVTVHHLLKHLKSKIAGDDVKIWYDDSIKSGQAWKPSDKSRLYDTDIFILFISNAFMYSEFIKQLEFKIIIDRYKAGTSNVIPLILENCPWDIDFEADDYTFNLNELHVLPIVGKPVRNWDSADQALQNSAAYIEEVIGSLGEGQKRNASALEDKKEEVRDQLAISFAEEAEAKKKALDEIRAREEAAKKKVEEQRKLEAENLEKKRAEEIWFQERMDTTLETVGVEQTNFQEEEADLEGSTTINGRSLLMGAALLALVVALGTFYYKSTRKSEELSPAQRNEVVVTNDNDKESNQTIKEPKTSTLSAGASMAKLGIGDRYNNGIIFEIDDQRKMGIIAHMEDAGPMTWNEAMKIHELLGEGWRLPTLDELKLMHSTIGQGANNSGEFTDGLYWSATPYDSNQARLVRFQDGNTTFHYNSIGTFRKFPVRAIRDFRQ